MTIFQASQNLISILLKGKVIGGKYLKRWQVSNPKTGKMKWVYKYKPVSQRGAHEVTKNKFEKVTKLSGTEHKNAVEKALQSGNRVSLHILRDYPDLVQKYGMSKRLERADKINAKVKEIRGKNQTKAESGNDSRESLEKEKADLISRIRNSKQGETAALRAKLELVKNRLSKLDTGTETAIPEEPKQEKPITDPPAVKEKDPVKIDKAIQETSPENREETQNKLFEPAKTEEEAEALTDKLLSEKKFKPDLMSTSISINGQRLTVNVQDYSKITPDMLVSFKQKNILQMQRPEFIPEINEKDFVYSRCSFLKLPLVDGTYLVSLDSGNSEDGWIKTTADHCIAIEDFYTKLAKEKVKNNIEIGGRRYPKITTLKVGTVTGSQFDFIKKNLVNEPDRTKADRETWQHIRKMQKDLKYAGFDLELRRKETDSGNTYNKGQETSYGNTGTVDELFDSMGVKVKMQNGSAVNKESLSQIQKHLTEVYSAFGDRSEMSKKYGLKISHAGKKMMHARKALGVFFPTFKAIGVSFIDKEKGGHAGMTLAHEFGHFMDHYLGAQKGFASEKHGSIENQIARTFREGIGREYQDKGYWARTCECFARAMECYYNHKIGQPHDERNGVNPDEKHYLEKVKPLIDKFFQEKDSLLKAFMRTV